MFYDHHQHPLTHLPISGRSDSEDYPDIVGAFEERYGHEPREDDETYPDIPYHCVETAVEAKAICDKDGNAQATRYAYKIQPARSDHPGYCVLSIKPGHFHIIFSPPLKPVAYEHMPWTDLTALCARVYSLYDPLAEDHSLYDRTVSWFETADHQFGRLSWTVRARGKDYKNSKFYFVGDPWGRWTMVLRIEDPSRGPTIAFREAYIDCGRCFNEVELFASIHEDGYLPGVVPPISSEVVKTPDGREIVFALKDGLVRERKKTRIVLADIGYDLFHAKSVNDILMTIYDALDVHRTMASERRVLHRDMSIFNIMMYPLLGPRPNPQKYFQDCPPLIDEVLDGKTRNPADRRARCLIIDCDNAARLTARASTPDNEVKDEDDNEEELRCRTGTPSYIARAVCGGRVHCDPSTLYWMEQMPLLDGSAKELYIQVYGEDRYNKYNDPPGLIHGGKPPQNKSLRQLYGKAQEMPFYHRWEYDAESIFWTMLGVLLRVTPVNFQEKPTDITAIHLNKSWKTLRDHVISDGTTCEDTRNTLLSIAYHTKLVSSFPPVMKPVALLLIDIIFHVLPPYPLMDELPPHDDHLHEAMERLILQYLVKNRDNPIPLKPNELRKLSFSDVHAMNRGTRGGSKHSLLAGSSGSRGEKRPLELDGNPDPTKSTKQPRRSERLAAD
ncbi:hypothetical protein C8Q73DRAFT_778384 [Cubamyces lactineus]|nr:hypothetical protein C8Q73DRAFT_778384 [Cubamyces lactineus]